MKRVHLIDDDHFVLWSLNLLLVCDASHDSAAHRGPPPVRLKCGPPDRKRRPALERANGGDAPKIMLMARGVFHCNCAKLSLLA